MAPGLDAEASFLCVMGSFPEPRRRWTCGWDSELWQPAEGGLWIMVMESTVIPQTSFDRPSNQDSTFWPWWIKFLKKCLKFFEEQTTSS